MNMGMSDDMFESAFRKVNNFVISQIAAIDTFQIFKKMMFARN
jgi:hypothetical protein